VHEAFASLAQARTARPTLVLSAAYVGAAVRNACFTILRTRRRRAEDQTPLVEPVDPGATEEERLAVDAAIRQLPPEQREVVYLKVFEGLTFQEIADRCGLSINTAGSRYRYAMDALRRSLGTVKARP
jgi:RNA polymerase sigma-70 factor (ECF subfamily)